MRNIDFTPLHRSFIGFDHLASMLDAASRTEKSPGYPPYNIEQTNEHNYRITMAVAGFSDEELSITSENNHLLINGKKADKSPESERQFIYKGISERGFERKFQLGDHVKVVSADLENGLLHIDLEREIPEKLKAKTIPIGAKSKLIEPETE